MLSRRDFLRISGEAAILTAFSPTSLFSQKTIRLEDLLVPFNGSCADFFRHEYEIRCSNPVLNFIFGKVGGASFSFTKAKPVGSLDFMHHIDAYITLCLQGQGLKRLDFALDFNSDGSRHRYFRDGRPQECDLISVPLLWYGLLTEDVRTGNRQPEYDIGIQTDSGVKEVSIRLTQVGRSRDLGYELKVKPVEPISIYEINADMQFTNLGSVKRLVAAIDKEGRYVRVNTNIENIPDFKVSLIRAT